MKHKAKDFTKPAWSSRVTAPLIKIDLVIHCKNLPKKDLLSQADSFCVLWQVPNGYSQTDEKGLPNKLPLRQEVEKGRTEISRATVNPTFDHKFRLEYCFHEEQTYIVRVYDEDLPYATDLKEHDYLGGCVFTLGQLMGAKGCAIAKRLVDGKSYMVVTGKEIVKTKEVLEFRFSCQDLMTEQRLINQSKVLDNTNPYFRLEKLNPDDQSWETIWKSEVIKDTLNPTWMEARLPLQLLCNDDQNNPLKITIWDYEKHSSSHDQMGFVESTVNELVSKATTDIPVFEVMREKKKWFGGSKLKPVGLLKVLKASVVTIPSMLQFLSGGCSLDLMIGIDCTTLNGDLESDQNLHYSASHWLNDYQAGIQKLGTIVENFARGRHSSIWGFGGLVDGVYRDKHKMADRLCLGKELLHVYDKKVAEAPSFELGSPAFLKPLVQSATFRTIRASKKRQCYTLLCVFTAGEIADLQESVDLVCTAAEDAPVSLIIIGVGNRDFSEIRKLTGDETGRLRDSRGIPIAREIVNFVSFKQFGGNAGEVIAEALKEIPEQFVQYHVSSGIKPHAPVPPPNFGGPKPNGSNPPSSDQKEGAKNRAARGGAIVESKHKNGRRESRR